MPLAPLDNLVKIGQLKAEAPAQSEIDAFIRSGDARLHDAANTALAIESRFDLAYNASYAFALAALRWHGYRPDQNRSVVFQTLAHTLKLEANQWRVLAEAHNRRNMVEYEALIDIDEELVESVVRVTREVVARLSALGPV
jgi:uncharacterized protein (UPF0332 family)